MKASRLAGLCVLLGTSALTSMARADAPAQAPAAQSAILDDIVVTARRTEERLQDVPIAVTAFNSAALAQKNITDIRAIGAIAPGLTIAEANSPATLILTIRGLANVNPLTGADATVGFYFNDVPNNIQSGTNLSLFDIENIQVLKGPQGTLFGRNTPGGAILINSARPTDKFEGYVQAGGTFFQVGHGVQGEAVVNLPLTPTLALRLAGRVVDRQGFVRNLLPRNSPDVIYGAVPLTYGRTKFENMLKEKSQAARASLRWSPEGFTSLLVYDFAHMRGDALPTFATALNPNGPVVQFAPFLGFPDPTAAYAKLLQARKDYFWTTYNVANTPLHVTSHTLSNTTTVELSDSITLKNIMGFRQVHEDYGEDIVGLPGAYFSFKVVNKARDLSEELQLQGKSLNGRLNWVTGVFLFDEHRSYDSLPVAFAGVSDDGYFRNRSRSYSGFAQGTYKLTDALSLTLGGRYNFDKRSATLTKFHPDASGGFQTCVLVGGSATNCLLVGSRSDKAFTYTASIDYKLDPATLLYAATRRGYRAGGFSNSQTTLTGGFIGFLPETITDYEIGAKRTTRIGEEATLRTNIAVFYQDYKNVQRLAVAPNDFTNQLIVNAPKAIVSGGEFEAELKPVRWLTIGYSYARVVPKYKNFIVGGVDYSGNTFAYASRNTHNASLTLDAPLADNRGEINFNIDYHYQSFQYYDGLIQGTNGGVYPPGTFGFGGYSIVNAKITWKRVMGGPVDIDIFGKNLTNTKILPNGSPSTYPTLGNSIGMYSQPPLMAGFDVRYNF